MTETVEQTTLDSTTYHALEDSNVSLNELVVAAIRTVYDPEIPVNIYDLGLIYYILESTPGNLLVQMTLTAPGCPVAGIMPGQVEAVVANVEGVSQAQVELIWDPPWGPERMSDEARLELGMM